MARESQQRDEAIQKIERFAHLMDARWKLPIFGTPFGLDFLIGLVPVVGDIFTGLVSLWLVNQARIFNVSRWLYVKMALNILMDVILGSVPILGDLFDLKFRANLRNARLLHKTLAAQNGQSSGD